MATWDDVAKLGYSVSAAVRDARFVSGFGVATYVATGDQAQIDSLADPVLHAARIAAPKLSDEPAATPALPRLDPKTATLADVIDRLNKITG